MRWKQVVVCLLALAGSAALFLAARSKARESLDSRRPAVVSLPTNGLKQRTLRAFPLASPFAVRARLVTKRSPAPQSADLAARPAITIPMAFEPNVGQADSDVKFIGRGKGITVFLTRAGVAIRVAKPSAVRSKSAIRPEGGPARDGILTLKLAGASRFSWRGEEKLRGESNYFVGNDRSAWRTRVPHFARAKSANVARGVSMSIYGNERGVEYDLRLAAGSDPSKLRLALAGARNVRLDRGGNLVMEVGGNELTMKKPAVYQYEQYENESGYEETRNTRHSSGTRGHRVRGATRAKKYSPRNTRRASTRGIRGGGGSNKPKRAAKPCTAKSRRDIPCTVITVPRKTTKASARRKAIDAGYVIETDGSVGFHVGPHDPRTELVIDPSLSVAYESFMGGAGSDSAASIAVDSAGKIYVGGTTTSATTFPESTGTRVGPADGPAEFFIAKIDPAMAGPNSLIYLTFLGGSGTQAGGLLAVDGSGDVAITGTTTASDFPVTDATQPTSGLASGYGNDTVVSEIGPTGSGLIFSTIFGGSGAQSQGGAGGIALDSSGDVYIASDTHTTPVDSASADLPVTATAYQTAWDGEVDDGFLAIFAPPAVAGGAATLNYCSYLGTNSVGLATVGGIAVDASGNAYIAGSASIGANAFPTKNAIQSAYGGGASDAFLMKITPGGQGVLDLIYATLLGGSGADSAAAVGIDSAATPDAYVTGTTQSSNFPTNGTTGGYQASLHANATANAFLAVVGQNAISGQASLAYSTYVGGSESDAALGIAVASPNAVYVTGRTTSWDFPWRDNLQPFNGAADAFVAKFDTTIPGATALIYATPLGGTSPPGGAAMASGNAVAADQSGHAYVAGATTAADFPTAVTTAGNANGFQPACASCQESPPATDGFVAEIAESAAAAPSVYFNTARLILAAPVAGSSGAPQLAAVLNSGDANLTISNIQINGLNAGDFSLIGASSCVGATISPGPSPTCSFEVGFAPSTAGPESAVVAVSDNAPGSPQVLELTGTGAGALAVISPASLNFGNQTENSTSQAQMITLTNAGNQNLVLSGLTETGPDSVYFPFASDAVPGSGVCYPGVSLAPEQSCVASVTFAPVSLRAYQAQIDFVDNSGNVANAEQTVQMAGTGSAAVPTVSLSASVLNFASQAVGGASGAQAVTLTNPGVVAVSITGIAISGTNAADFAIASSGTTCPIGSGTLPIGASCTVAVRLAPQTAGSKSATLIFTDNAATTPQMVALSGVAIVTPTLTVSPGSLSFAAQSEGTVSASQVVTISNTGSSAAGISAITVTGVNAADFALSNPCAPTLAAGANCQISVSFSPATGTPPGAQSATLNIPTGTPQTVALSGAVTQAGISLPASFAFTPQLAGTSGTAQPVTVTNSSTGAFAGALTISSVTKGGTNPGDFAVTADSCIGASTPPGATCSIELAFAPAEGATCGAGNGARTATLILNDNAPGSPHSVPVSGTAMDFCIDAAPGQPVSEPISAGQQATYSLEIVSSMGFSGTVALACAGAPPVGTCAVNTTPATTPTVVQVTPTAPGQFQLVVTTAASSAAPGPTGQGRQRPNSPRVVWLVITLAAILMAWTVARSRLRASAPTGSHGRFAREPEMAAQICTVLFLLAMGMAACGGGGGGAVAVDPPGTPTGTYTITITATVGTVTRTIPVNVTVD